MTRGTGGGAGIIVFGAPNTGDRDAEMAPIWWRTDAFGLRSGYAVALLVCLAK